MPGKRVVARRSHAPVLAKIFLPNPEREVSDCRTIACYLSAMKLVAGVDSSTQSTKVLLVRAEDGAVVAEASAPHPDGTECHPDRWWEALSAAGRELLERADAVGVAAQQHGMVTVGDAGQVVRPAMLWNDVKSAPQAAAMVAEFGGPAEWAARTGSVPTMSFTVTKLRWLAEHEPEHAALVSSVMLPHDWLTWRLAGGGPRGEGGGAGSAGSAAGTGGAGSAAGARSAAGTGWNPSAEPVTDRGDASGTGYFSPAESAWRPDYAERALGRPVRLPRLAAPSEVIGTTSWGAALSAGTGDNMGAALGLGLADGDVAVSIGTSGTAYAVTSAAAADPSGLVSGFADATGRFLPLACTLNAARVLDVTARMLGTDPAGLSDLAMKAEAGAGGLVLLPYLDGERTPNRPAANGVLRGLTTANATPENLARAAVEAVLCSLADAVDCLRPCGITPSRVVLTGGAARSQAVRAIAPAVFGLPVVIPEAAEYVALGAARQAAWALAGTVAPPSWPARPSATYEAAAAPGVREQYTALRDDAAAWQID
jgi:xylulokinase